MINIHIEDRGGNQRTIELSEYLGLNLMETLKLEGYEMRATCGGIALCADCHCVVSASENNIACPSEQELITLDTRPDYQENSRLACQLMVNTFLNGLRIRLTGYEN